MASKVQQQEFEMIIKAVQTLGQTADIEQLTKVLPQISRRTLQRRLQILVKENFLKRIGQKRNTQYILPDQRTHVETAEPSFEKKIYQSEASREIQKYVSQPLQGRKPVGYQKEFLDLYKPNVDYYLRASLRKYLKQIGTKISEPQAAGTYANKILQRLLIDLSWNSSRLEGNTYSLLETQELIEFGKIVTGKDSAEAQMILNHKAAIEMLVHSIGEVGVNAFTIKNIHGLLSDNLLADPGACGRLRHIEVRIGKSVYHPLAVPQQIEEYFIRLLKMANQIQDPFEQSFFLLVHLPYLQPFEDVNKGVSRLAANIPFIKQNLCPLSFIDVPQTAYLESLLGIYEMNRTNLMVDVFEWAYTRSTERYAAIKQSLGEPDPFKLQYRTQLFELIHQVVKESLIKTAIQKWIGQHIPKTDCKKFNEVVEIELRSLHEGNIARYRLRLSEFKKWKQDQNMS